MIYSLIEYFLLERGPASKPAKPKVDKEGSESDTGSATNTALADAYETLTALEVHNNSASKDNKDPEHQKRIANMQAKHKAAMALLPPEKRKDVIQRARDSANAYFESLKKEGINPEDIKEVHHTNKGIGPLLGRDVSQAKNPPDIAIRLKKPNAKYGAGPNKDLHFASLKFSAGTASNNGIGSMDELGTDPSKIKTNLRSVWQEGAKRSGADQISKAELRRLRKSSDPKDKKEFERLTQEYYKTQSDAMDHHISAFSGASVDQQRDHLAYLMKANPDERYHYVVGEKGGKSVSIENHPNVQALNAAKSFRMEKKGSLIHVYDDQNRHLLAIEHRATRGPWSGTQVNAKYGSLKSSTDKSKPVASSDTPAPVKTKEPPAPATRSSRAAGKKKTKDIQTSEAPAYKPPKKSVSPRAQIVKDAARPPQRTDNMGRAPIPGTQGVQPGMSMQPRLTVKNMMRSKT